MSSPEFLNKKLYRKGEIVFDEGSEGNTAFLIESGGVEVFKTVDGERVSLAHLGKGEMFGEMALIDQSPRMAGAQATEAASIVILPRSVLDSKLDHSDKFVRGLIKILVANLRNVHQSYMRRARSIDDYLGDVDFFLAGLGDYLETPDGEAVSDQAMAHLERIDEAVFELKAVFKDHHDRRDSVLRESDTTPQGRPEPPAEVADLVADEGEDQPEQ